MAILNPCFEELISAIEPDKEIKEYAQEAHAPVRDYLKQDPDFKDFFINSFLYGSYKRSTAVGDIEDIDIAVITNFDPNDQSHTPSEVLRRLKKALNNYYEIEDNTEYQRKSIKVKDALPENQETEISLDVIPAIAPNGEDDVLLVPDRELRKWVSSHPKAHLDYATNLNKENNSGGRYIPLVKLMKWWWKYQSEQTWPQKKHKPKGFWVECLTGLCFDPSKEDWAEHFIFVLENILAKYGDYSMVPDLPDPGLSGSSIKTSMTAKEYQEFIEIVESNLREARRAYADTNKLTSSVLWQKVFGKNFPLAEDDIEPFVNVPVPSRPGPLAPPLPPRPREVG